MENSEFFSESFFSIEQMTSFLRYLEKQHNNNKRSYRLGVVSPDKNEKGKHAVYLSSNEARLPVIWLYNTGHGHWHSIGPSPEKRGLVYRKRWDLESNIKTVVDNGLYRVKRDVDGVDREYLLGSHAGQWVYQVERPSQLSDRPGYIYVHTTQGPNQDAWKVPGDCDASSVRGEEGFILVEALEEVVFYTVLERGTFRDKKKGAPGKKITTNTTKLGQSKKLTSTAGGSTPTTTGITQQPTTKPSTTKQSTTKQPTTKQPPAGRQINISGNLPGAPKIARPPPGINRQSTGATTTVAARPPASIPNDRIFRMFRARLPDRNPQTKQRFKEGHLVYNHDQVLLALDHIDDESPPAVLRVRSQDEKEGLAELKNLDEIDDPFHLDDSAVHQPKSNEPDVAFPEADFPLAKLQGQCRLRSLSTTGTRQELARRLIDEQQRRGVALAVFRMRRSAGSFANGSLVRLQNNRMPEGVNQVLAWGLQGRRSFGHALAADLLQEGHAWGIRLVARQGATPPNRGTANIPLIPQKTRQAPPRSPRADEVAALLSDLATTTPGVKTGSRSGAGTSRWKVFKTPHKTHQPPAGTTTGTKTGEEPDNPDESHDWYEVGKPMPLREATPSTPMPPAEAKTKTRTRTGMGTRTERTPQSDASRAMPPPLLPQRLKGQGATVTPTGSPIAKAAAEKAVAEKGKRARDEDEDEEDGGQTRKKKKETEKKKSLLPPEALKLRKKRGKSGDGADAGGA